ncbi:SAM-dependent methyltransferase [Nocardia miyunensis]|uniref:SAM-dependent methyltransferase n=1 Tax=Nocardia miyunensis TaxID=282684 RepID=UPI00082953E6|nr:SAM-dependent methyltransferase [Nocardia miyunensis]
MTNERGVDPSKPSSARIYDYFLGGKDNYEVDRQAAAKILEVWPTVASGVHHNRDFMARAVRTLSDLETMRRALATYRASGVHAQNRNRDEVTRLFDGYELLDPGVVGVHRWRPEADLPEWRDAEAGCWAGVARKN